MKKKKFDLIAIFLYLLVISCGMPPRDKAKEILRKGLEDKSAVVGVNAAKGLAEIGDEKGYEFLYKTLNSDNKEAIVAALSALLELKEKRISPIVIKLSSSEDPLIRAESYRLIATFSDTVCYSILIYGTKDRVARIRRYAYQGLTNFKDLKTITKGLKDPDPIVRINASRSLGLLGDKIAKDFIRKEMDPKNPNLDVWSQAVIALGEICDTSATSYIKELLFDTPWDLRISAAQALLSLNNPDGIEILKNGIQSPDPFVRVKSIEVMRKFPIQEFYELIKKACADEYINVSINAIEALKLYHKKEDLKLFEKLMSAQNPLVKIAAATAYLKETGGR